MRGRMGTWWLMRCSFFQCSKQRMGLASVDRREKGRFVWQQCVDRALLFHLKHISLFAGECFRDFCMHKCMIIMCMDILA